jgi:hypothetical protein
MEHLEKIQSRIYEVRGVRVMLDFDLAALYQVETRVLKQAVRRNLERFPEDFLFRLTLEESNLLIYNGVSQIVIPPGYNPGGAEMFAFTEQGVAMLSSVLRSPRAIEVNISIMRAFVAMRNYIMSTRHIESELAELRAKLELLERNDEENLAAVNDLSEDMRNEIATIYDAIAALSVKAQQSGPQLPPRQKIGYKTGKDEKK